MHFKDDEISLKGATLVELADAIKYSWVDAEMVGTPSILNTTMAIDMDDIVVIDPLNFRSFPWNKKEGYATSSTRFWFPSMNVYSQR